VALKRIFAEWQRGMHNLAWNALFWCNHDQPRIVSRLGDDGALRTVSAKMLAMVLHGMQGTPYIYQGEEIGMTNPHFSRIDQYRDVESLNMFKILRLHQDEKDVLAVLAHKSRDNGRTPVQWDDSENAGFTDGESWIDVADNYRQINVVSDMADSDSVLHTYRELIALRKKLPVLTFGDYQDLDPDSPACWCYQRDDEAQTLRVIANLSGEPLALNEACLPREAGWRLLYGNYADGAQLLTTGTLRPYECGWWLRE